MTTLHPVPPVVNALASVIDASSPLDAAEAALSMASLFLGHARLRDARQALSLAFAALHLGSIEAADPRRLATLARAAREADELLDEAMGLDGVPTLGEAL